MMDYLLQETRHKIIQVILGHPEHLVSVAELDYFIPDESRQAITEHLNQLQDAGVIAEHTHTANRSEGLPWRFYAPSETGIEVLSEHNYLHGVPMARAIIAKTRTNEEIDRCMDAPRPSLPAAVSDRLTR